MSSLGSASQPVNADAQRARRCVFCDEDIRAAATICPHCRNTLAPFQELADRCVVLQEKIAMLETDVAALRAGAVTIPMPEAAASIVAAPASIAGTWPHMLDNIFLGMAALLAAHWLATTLPVANRAVFRLVALCVALPFGYRFERNARQGAAGQVIAALGFGSFGTLAIAVLDMAVAGHAPLAVNAQDVIESVAAISLSHFAGSALAQTRQSRADRVTLQISGPGVTKALLHLEPARVKSTADMIKSLYEAATPLAAGGAALWAAFGHTLF